MRVVQRERGLRLAERPRVGRDAVVRSAVAERARSRDVRPSAEAALRVELHLRVVVDERRAGDCVDDVDGDRLGHAVDAERVVRDREARLVRARVRLVAQRADFVLA